MIVAGIDIGSTACKAVILVKDTIAGYAIGPATTNPAKNASDIYEQALKNAGLSNKAADYVVGTGYGRAKVPFADENVSELTCHGRGSAFVNPAIRTVLDIGGQDTKSIRIDDEGFLVDYAMNDKCAAGTGRFLEAMARTLGLTLTQMEEHSANASHAAVITSMCSVFAESEVINLINDGVEIGQIVRGLHEAMVGRVAALARRVGVEEQVIVTGGVAKSSSVLNALAAKIGVTPITLPKDIDPQIIGALGAAVCASEKGSS
ncbi:MAG: 2-hydroxyglutaryl-CoA dehydratase [Deltaproteobacteria bacterium]|nr:2-hydroxyglutaryl-CoA dehydratase [Deltaproteobacteria bacterium]